jgi:hypothetical protein
MSQENVEIARRVVDAVNQRDVATLDSLWSEEGEFNSRLAASEGHVFRGRQGIRDYSYGSTRPSRSFEARSRRSSTQARIGSSSCSGQVCVERQAASPSTTSASPSSSSFRASGSPARTAISAQPKPSKPPGRRSSEVVRFP